MASYTTNLKTWGAAGAEYPDGYNYVEGEQPVDEWDNFLTTHIVSDIKDHLIPLTNSRIEADYGGTGGEPGSPEASHLYHDQGGERLELWDTDKGEWRDIMFRDGDTMTGALDMGNYPVENHTDLVDQNGAVVWDHSAGHIPQGRLQNDSVTVNAGTGLNGGGTVALGGSVNVDVDDSRYVLESGDTMSGSLDMDGNAVKMGNGNIDRVNDLRFTDANGDEIVIYQSGTSEVKLVPKTSNGPITLESDKFTENGNRVATRKWTNNNFYDTGQADNKFVHESGDTMTGRLRMETNDLYFQPGSAGGSVTAITFESNSNSGSDYGYIEYHDDYWTDADTNDESSALRLVAQNDGGYEGAGPDAVVLSGIAGTFIDEGNLNLDNADINKVNGNDVQQTIWDDSAGHVPSGSVQSNGLDADTVDGQHASELGQSESFIKKRALAYDFI
jgi:hypothetical protein